MHFNMLEHSATHCNIIILKHTATHCNTLQHTATHCNTLQEVKSRIRDALQQLPASADMLYLEVRCSVLQCDAV